MGNGLTLGSVRRIVKSQMFIFLFLFLFLCEYIFKAIHHTVQSLLYWLSWEQKTDLVSFVSANAKNKNVLLWRHKVKEKKLLPRFVRRLQKWVTLAYQKV